MILNQIYQPVLKLCERSAESSQYLDLLSCRMSKGEMILVYKILHGSLEGVQWLDFFQMGGPSRLRGHSVKLRKERSRQVYIQPKSSEHVECPTHRHSHSTNGEGFQKLLEAHFKRLPGWPPE